MSESDNLDEDTFSFQEIYDFEARNLAGCDNDDTCCTFPKGYVYRQALYNCVTCHSATGKPAGICYPCSVHCHDGHMLEDLYTKRNFRCDCGNGNFPDEFQCKLWEEKDDLNTKNHYNHNFSGRYCVCDAEYDDDAGTAKPKEIDNGDANEQDNNASSQEMLQCIFCEDWFHLKHLCDTEAELCAIDFDGFEEFVCKLCLASREFVQLYSRASAKGVLRRYSADDAACNLEAVRQSLDCQSANTAATASTCGAFFMTDWRLSLCRCASCLAMLAADGSMFLLDSRDTINQYVDGNAAQQQRDENEFQAELSRLPYSQAIRFAEGVATLKREFSDFISSRDPTKVVTPDDIHNFFDKIKRRRL